MNKVHGPDLILGEQYLRDPHSIYSALRESVPISLVVTPSGDHVWLVTRYDDVRAALKNSALSLDAASLDALVRQKNPDSKRRPFLEILDKHMLNSDPPTHTRLRQIVSRSFTAGRVEDVRARVEVIVSEYLDRMGEARDFDLIESYARPVPIAVIGELLGVPENGRVQVGIWSKIIFSDVSKTDRVHASNELLLFLKDLISARPVEASCGILRELLDAASGADRLSPPEIVSMIALLLVAGHETTMNLIANASRLLLLAPGLASRIVSNPTLISGAVEEFLRFDGPVNVATMRHTVRPTVIGDVEIPAGELVLLALASANRDASKFQAPDVINIGREQRNLAFGHGVHHCIGAPLARLEGTIAILRLMERFPHLHLAVDESVLRWRGSILMRGLESLPVSIRAHSESADERLEL